jgi:hypothetical protein
MSVVETPTTISIMTDTVDAVNAKLNEYIDQIQTDCKSDLESYIREKMTIYYGKQLNQTFPTFTVNNIINRNGRSFLYPRCLFDIDIIYVSNFEPCRGENFFKQLIITPCMIQIKRCKCINFNWENRPQTGNPCNYEYDIQYGGTQTNPIDVNNPSIQILIDLTLKVFPMRHATEGVPAQPVYYGDAIYKSFVEMTKTFETHPLRYVQTDSKLISDLNAQRESVRNKKEQIAEDIAQNIKDNKYLDEMTAQLKLEKQELQDYRNIKQEIEKCNILKRQLVIVKAGLAKEQAQLVLDKAQFEKEQTESLNIDLDDELFQFNT